MDGLSESSQLEFPRLRNAGKIEEHKETVLRFMSKKQALYKKFGFVEDELIEEFGYPNQKFVLWS